MNVVQWIELHKDCPLSFLFTHADAELRREPSIIGKAFWNAVLERL